MTQSVYYKKLVLKFRIMIIYRDILFLKFGMYNQFERMAVEGAVEKDVR